MQLIHRHQVAKENRPKVPAYIVTFSDMVTLLLTFFVMLLTLAQVQDPELFNKGRDAFLHSIRYVGLGMLFGRQEKPCFGNIKIKYYINNPDNLFEGKTIDAKEEEISRIFKQLSQSMKAMPSQIAGGKTNFSVTDIHFPRGDATLNESAKRFLTKFSFDLQQEPRSGGVRLYVLGLAGDEATGGKEQWILSARRAQAVADFLQDTLTSGSNWPVYSWGAGPGGDWVAQESPISKQSQILIAVLRAND